MDQQNCESLKKWKIALGCARICDLEARCNAKKYLLVLKKALLKGPLISSEYFSFSLSLSRYVHGCVQSCDDVDACNAGTRRESNNHFLLGSLAAIKLSLFVFPSSS